MAKDWAKQLYKSKAWKKCRESYIASVFGLCERCNDGTPGKIVHHKIWLDKSNINDHSISLNHEHLEYLCQLCHNREHHGNGEDVTRDDVMFDEYGNLIERMRFD